MTFLSPWMLAGAAAVGVPVALHFFYKARYRRLPWAAMSFLREAIEQTSRRLKFQEWILLALRCLVILLLALALARPGRLSVGGTGRGEAVDAVLVFDTSYSMAAREGDRTRLDLAKEAALGVLDSLPPNSSVQMIACADRVEKLGPQSRFNLDQARQLIPTVEPTSLATDFLPGLTAALDAAETGTAPVKEIYLFTDLQKAGFERQQGAIRDACDRIKTRANLVLVRCGKADRKLANVAVTDVQAVGTIPHTKTRVPFVVSLKNTGTDPVKGIKVGLELDGRAVERDVVQVEQIDPGQVVPVTLTGTLDEPGLRVLTVRVTGDALPGDNRLDRLILVRDVIRVLLVDGAPDRESPAESASHFVRNALTPVPENRTEEFYIRPQVVTAAEVGPANLASVDVVYLLNAPAPSEADPRAGLPADFVARLKEFVAAGGGLVIGSGDQVRPADYNRVLGSSGVGLLPFDLAGPAEAAPEADPFAPAPESVEEKSFLAPFRDPPFSSALRAVGIGKLLPVRESGAGSPGGRVLVRTADGKPFVSSRVVGEGEVVFVGTTLDERWTNFPGRGSDAFVPFTQFALAHLTGRKVPGGNKTAGEPLVWFPPEAAAGYELLKPQRPGEPAARRVRLDRARSTTAGDKLTVTVPPNETADAGVYRVVPDGSPDTKGAVFAAAPDLRESANLDCAADGDLRNWLGFEPVVITAGAGTEAAVNEVRVRREWTEWVLLAVLAFLVAEGAWAWVCGRAW
ncbi:MAG: BatA domain-containing protein [Gemmataceae bacterium]|nr:BatA domain-containing protein [Gemmataceae bacterium]